MEIGPDVRRVLENRFKAQVRAAQGDLVKVTPGGVVGSVRVGRDVVVVRPKLDIARVLFLVAYAGDPYRWEQGMASLGEVDDLTDGVAALFARTGQALVARGLLRAYRRVDTDAPVVRGRVRWARQARRVAPVPIAVRHDVHDDDVTENRIVRAAVAALRRAQLSPSTARGLAALWRSVEHVSPVADPVAAIDRLVWTRHNQHYRPLARLSRVVLAGSADVADGELAVPGFTLHLHDVFEQFVRRALQVASRWSAAEFPDSWARGGMSLADDGSLRLAPDLGVRVDGSWRFVGDVKYKRDGSGAGHGSDTHQALAYAVATGLPEATLVYAEGPAAPVTHVVRHLGVRLHVRHVDLTAPPHAVLAALAQLAKPFARPIGAGRR